MRRINAKSPNAALAMELVETLQARLVRGLERVNRDLGDARAFEPVEWLRDDGRHGGGVRYVSGQIPIFNQASVNVSGVHYDDNPDKRLSSATALSSIIHPENPRAPSVHMHISWTEMRDGSGYWRIMADLNPAIPDDDDRRLFEAALERTAPTLYEHARAQGERYFSIPALERRRGVAHFYLEGFATTDERADRELARTLGEATIDCYVALLARALERHPRPSADEYAQQLAYHTVYLFQVLTLDRGTTSGLLVHDQNDVGILGSLPAFIDRALLASWRDRMPPPQDQLLGAIARALPDANPCPLTSDTRRALAQVVRAHYRAHPDALALQAAGDIIPPTVDNHS